MSAESYIKSGILELYVAGALSPEEMKEVEAMASADARIREEIENIEEGMRKYASFQAPARHSDIFDKIEARIQSEPQAPATDAKTVPLQAKQKQKPAAVKAEKEPRRAGSGGRTGLYLLLAASVIFLAVSVGLNVYMYQQWEQSKSELADMHSEYNRMSQEYSSTKTSYSKTLSELDMIQNPKMKMIHLSGQPMAPHASGMVLWNAEDKSVYLKIAGLPQAPAGKQYQLWAISPEDEKIDAGMLGKSTAENTIAPMKKVAGAKAFAITLEPEGGSLQPTSDIYTLGAI